MDATNSPKVKFSHKWCGERFRKRSPKLVDKVKWLRDREKEFKGMPSSKIYSIAQREGFYSKRTAFKDSREAFERAIYIAFETDWLKIDSKSE